MSRKLDELGVSAFCESMAMMLGSGIHVDEAISLLRKEGGSGTLELALESMEPVIEQGGTLGAAMEQSGVFPDYALKMTAAAEASGRLEDVMYRLARYYADQKTIGEKLRNAVTYPAAMLVLIIAVLTVMLTMVLPMFTDVYDTLTGSMTAAGYGYIRWAYGFCWLALAVMAVLAAGLTAGLLLWNNGRRQSVEAALRHIPLCASILESMGMFRFTSALSTFLASGSPHDIAVIDSMKMVDYAPVEEKLKKCLTHMEEGHGFAQAAYQEDLFEPVYGRMLLAGERSGGLAAVLERMTGLLEGLCGRQVDRLVAIVDPLLSGVLMLTVGLSLISVMLPLVGMMNAIG